MDFDAWYQTELASCSDLGMKPWLKNYEAAKSVFEGMWPALQPKPRPVAEVSEISQLRAEVADMNRRLASVEHAVHTTERGLTEREGAMLDATGDAMGILHRQLLDRIEALEARPTALSTKGAWDPQENYSAGDIVSSGGSSWIARTANIGTAPTASASTIWQCLARRGRTGRDGIKQPTLDPGVA